MIQHQRHGNVELSDWATNRVKWVAAGGIDRFDVTDFASVRAGIETRWFADRVSARVTATHWMAAGRTGTPFTSGRAAVDWRSTAVPRASTWIARAGVMAVSASTPLAEWPIASSSDARGELLRAHALFDDGVIIDRLAGRRMAFATIEYQHVVWQRPFARLAVAGFMDGARAWLVRAGGTSPLEADVGAGIRVLAPGTGGAVRLDAAVGLEDGSTSLSAGYVIGFGR